MRPPCVLLLLAFAARPVGVAAQAELSDNVATDGRHEVQGHLRIRAHDADDDERTGPQVGELSSANVLIDAASLLKIPIAGTSRNNALNNEILNLETPDFSAKVLGKRKRLAQEELTYKKTIAAEVIQANEKKASVKTIATEAIEAYEKMKQSKNPPMFLDIFAALNKREDRAKVFPVANNILLEKGYTPDNAFEIYMLQSAGDKLFSPNLLFYWAKFLDAYNKKNRGKKILITYFLLRYYSFKDLVVAASIYSGTNISKRVLSDLQRAALKDEVHPAAVFEWLLLEEEKENSGSRYRFYWVYNRSYYQKFPEKASGLWKETEISIKDMEIDDDVGMSIPDEEKVQMSESMLKILADADLDTPK